MTEKTNQELSRDVDRLERAVKQHLEECTLHGKRVEEKLANLERYQVVDDTRRVVRQDIADRRDRNLRLYLAFGGAGLAVLSIVLRYMGP